MKLINSKEAAEQLGVCVQRVRQLIAAGRLPAQKVSRDWVIRERDLAKVAHRKHGRPKKNLATHEKSTPWDGRHSAISENEY